jgi:hypothetical protein
MPREKNQYKTAASPPKKEGMSARIIFCFVWAAPKQNKK